MVLHKTLASNSLLSAISILDDGSLENSISEAYQQIKFKIAEALRVGDLFISIEPWLRQLKDFLSIYGTIISFEDTTAFINVVYCIMATKYVDYNVLFLTLDIGLLIFNRKVKKTIKKGDIILDWLPLFKNLKHLKKKKTHFGFRIKDNELRNFCEVTKQLSAFFPDDAHESIWLTLRPMLSQQGGGSNFILIQSFMPHFPCLHQFASETWIPYMFSLFRPHLPRKNLANILEIVASLTYIFADRMDITPHLSLFIDLVMSSLPFDGRVKRDENANNKIILHSIASILVYSINSEHQCSFDEQTGRASDPLAALTYIIHRLRPHLHSQLSDKSKNGVSLKQSICSFLEKISESISNRYEYFYLSSIHSSLDNRDQKVILLSESQVDKLVTELWSCYELFIYNLRSVSLASHLVRLRPSMIIPKVIEEFYLGLSTVHETSSRLEQSLMVISAAVSHWSLACSNPHIEGAINIQPYALTEQWLMDGKKSLFTFIESLLPLISAENIRLTSYALPIFIEIICWFPFNNEVDGFDNKCSDLNDEEIEIRDMTVMFDDYLLDFIQRLCDLSLHCGHALNIGNIRKQEKFIFKNNVSIRPEMREKICKKLIEFYIENALSIESTEFMVMLIGDCCTSDALAAIYYPIILQRLEALVNENHLCFNGKSDVGYNAFMFLFSKLRPVSLYLYKDRVIHLFQRLYATPYVCVHEVASVILADILVALLTSSVQVIPDKQLYENPWYSNKWHVLLPREEIVHFHTLISPPTEATKFGIELLQMFVLSDIIKLKNIMEQTMKPPVTTTNNVSDLTFDDEINLLLTHIVCPIEGLITLLPVNQIDPIALNNEAMIYSPDCLPLIPNNLHSKLASEITFPDGSAVIPNLCLIVIQFWSDIENLFTIGNLRELTLKKLLQLTTTMLNLSAMTTDISFIKQQRSGNVVFYHSKRSAFFKIKRTVNQLQRLSKFTITNHLDEPLEKLTKIFINYVFHKGPPLNAIAAEGIKSILSIKRRRLCKFVLDELILQFQLNYHQTTDQTVLLNFLHCIDVSRLCNDCIWLNVSYINIITQLLNHPTFLHSQELSAAFSRQSRAGIVTNFICKKPSKMIYSLIKQKNVQLSIEILSNKQFFAAVNVEDNDENSFIILFEKTKRLLEQRLHWLQDCLTDFIHKSNSLKNIHSNIIGAGIMAYLFEMSCNFLSTDHFNICFQAIESQNLSLTSVSVVILIGLLHSLSPIPPKSQCTTTTTTVTAGDLQKTVENEAANLKMTFPFEVRMSYPSELLHDDTTYINFVQLSSLKAGEGLHYWSPDCEWKSPISSEEFVEPSHMAKKPLMKKIWIQLRNSFEEEHFWSNLNSLQQVFVLGNSRQYNYSVDLLVKMILQCYGPIFLPQLLNFMEYQADQMKVNPSFYGKIGLLLNEVLMGIRFWPRIDYVNAINKITTWLITQRSVNDIWHCLSWKNHDTIQYLPFYHCLQTWQQEENSSITTILQRHLLSQFTYLSSITTWRASNTLPFFLHCIDDFLIGDGELLNIEMRSSVRHKFAQKIYVFDRCRHVVDPVWSSDNCPIDKWMADSLIPALAFYIVHILQSRQQVCNESTKTIAEQWCLRVKHVYQKDIPQLTISDALETLRIIIKLVSACGSHHPTFWRSFPILADLLPCLVLFPSMQNSATVLFNHVRHYSHASWVGLQPLETLNCLRQHDSPVCRKMYFACLDLIICYQSNCFMSPQHRQDIGKAVFELLLDPDDSVRQEAKNSLSRLLRVEYLTVNQHVQPAIIQLEKKKNQSLWAVIAALCAVLQAYPNQLSDFIPNILLKLASATSWKDRKVAGMARQQLSDFKHASKTIWPDLCEKMTSDDFALVNDCARSNADYYV